MRSPTGNGALPSLNCSARKAYRAFFSGSSVKAGMSPAFRAWHPAAMRSAFAHSLRLRSPLRHIAVAGFAVAIAFAGRQSAS